jgi:pimeloyl-ACP methyl ester carboxylesterase
MKKAYVTVEKNIQLHYRTIGKGQPIVLFHPSPRSSKMMETLGIMLSKKYRVIMPDLFGYGNSDALPIPISSLYDYVPYLKKAFKALKINELAIYGSATGAQLGIAYALTYPEDVKCLFLDNAAHFSEAESQNMIQNYFPDFTPQYDGSHIEKLWSHVVDSTQYFPWFDKSKPLNFPEAPAIVLNDIFKDYLIAGAKYDDAYKAAFLHEKGEHVQKLKVKTLIFNWLQSPLLPYINNLLAMDLPENVEIMETSGAERLAKMVASMYEVV